MRSVTSAAPSFKKKRTLNYLFKYVRSMYSFKKSIQPIKFNITETIQRNRSNTVNYIGQLFRRNFQWLISSAIYIYVILKFMVYLWNGKQFEVLFFENLAAPKLIHFIMVLFVHYLTTIFLEREWCTALLIILRGVSTTGVSLAYTEATTEFQSSSF